MQIIIRPSELEDLPCLLAYRSDPRFQRLCPVKVQELAVEKARFETLLHDPARQEFTVCLSSQPIGSGNIRPFKSSALEIGFEISPDHWGQGYASQLCRFLLEKAMGLPLTQHVIGRCVAFNLGSQAVMRKAGMHLIETQQLPNGIVFVSYSYPRTNH